MLFDAIPLAALVPKTDVLLRRPGGIFVPYHALNTTAARGTAFRSALAAAVSLDVLEMGPGVFNTDATLLGNAIATGVTIQGSGIDVTTIETGMTTAHDNTLCLLDVADNVTIQDLTIHPTINNGTSYQLPLGRLRSGTCLNVVLRRVKIYAPNGSDGWYTWTNGSQVSVYLYDCIIQTAYDCLVNLSSNPGDTAYAENCYFESTGTGWTGTIGLGDQGYANNIVNKAGTMEFRRCRFKTRNDASGNVQTLACWNLQNDATTTFNDCEFDVVATNGVVSDLYRASAGTGGFIVSDGKGSGTAGIITTTGGNVTWNGNRVHPMTTTQRNALGATSLRAGLLIYDTTTNKMNVYNGSAWEVVTSAV